MVILWSRTGLSKYMLRKLSLALRDIACYYSLVDESWSTYSKLQLRDWFNNPHALLRDEALDSTLRGLVMSYPQASDKQFVHDVRSDV